MRTLATGDTADQLLDYLASDGTGAEWIPVADLGEWETLYNLRGETGFAGRLADALARRGLADVRRGRAGAELRLTPAGEALALERKRRVDEAVGVFIGRHTS